MRKDFQNTRVLFESIIKIHYSRFIFTKILIQLQRVFDIYNLAHKTSYKKKIDRKINFCKEDFEIIIIRIIDKK